jgi:hypothetical protein
VRLVIILQVLVVFACSMCNLRAGIEPLVITGDPAGDNLTFADFELAAINSSGQVAFAADAAGSHGVWTIQAGAMTLAARTGAGNVPGISAANFADVTAVTIDDQGTLFFRAQLEVGVGGVDESSRDGFWQSSGGMVHEVFRAGGAGVPELPSAAFQLFSPLLFPLSVTRDGRLATTATLVPGGEINSNNDKGIWIYESDASSTLAREADPAPQLAGGNYRTFAEPLAVAGERTAFAGSVNAVGDVVPSTSAGVWLYDDAVGTLIARSGSGGVAGLPGASYTRFEQVHLNEHGLVAVHAETDASGVKGVWTFDDGQSELVALAGAGGVPGVAGADFAGFDLADVNSAGELLVAAELAPDVGDVTEANAAGLWLFSASESRLLARTGSGGVPGVPGANFLDSTAYALNSRGQVAAVATLEQGPGGVTESNDSGLWVLDPDGTSQLLMREGDQLAGRTVAAVDFLAGSSDGAPRGFNDRGQIVLRAEFTSGESGLFLYTPLDGDFDGDGDVDGDDLAAWEAGFGSDYTGRDLLNWQREFGSGSTNELSSHGVPEPAAFQLLLLAACSFLAGSRVAMQRVRTVP